MPAFPGEWVTSQVLDEEQLVAARTDRISVSDSMKTVCTDADGEEGLPDDRPTAQAIKRFLKKKGDHNAAEKQEEDRQSATNAGKLSLELVIILGIERLVVVNHVHGLDRRYWFLLLG